MRATDDVEAILALDADCVCYSALGSTLDDREGPLDDICRLLTSARTSSRARSSTTPTSDPTCSSRAQANAEARLRAACEQGGSTFFHVGINPGFAMDFWPTGLSRLCRRIDKLTVTEIVDMTRYQSIHMVRDAIGFGVPPDQPVLVDAHNQDVYESAYYVAMRMLADAIGIQLDEVRYHREVATTDRTFEIAAGAIEAGTVAAMKFVFDGIVDDRPVLSLQMVWRVSNDVHPSGRSATAGGCSTSTVTRSSTRSS